VAGLNPQPDCIDLEQQLATPIVPNDGSIRVYADATSGNLAAIKSDGTSALPSATPAGSAGDVQFNSGTALANANDVAVGASFNMDSSGDLAITVPGSCVIQSTGSVVNFEAMGSMSFRAQSGAMNFNAGSSNFVALASAAVFEVLDGNLLFDATNNPSNITFQASSAQIKFSATHINFANLQVFANNAAAIAGGLLTGDVYRTGADPDPVCIVH
jgi:hypothetical protein